MAGGALVWQPLLAGVSQLQLSGWIAGQGWVAAEALAGQLRGAGEPTAAEGASPPGAATGGGTAAVTGLIVRVVRTDGRVLQRVLPVKD